MESSRGADRVRAELADATSLRQIARIAIRRAADGGGPARDPLVHADRANLSSNGLVVKRGFVLPEEREAMLAYLRRL